MKKFLLTTALAVGVMAGPAMAETINIGTGNVNFNREVDRQIAPGVQYLYLKAPNSGSYGRHVFLTIVDLTEPTVSVEYYTASGTTGGSRKSLTDIAAANTSTNHRVVAGANANFWISSEQPWASQMSLQPHGTAIHDGAPYVQNATGGYGSHIGGPSQTGMIAYTKEGRMKINYYVPKLEFLNTRINHVLDIRDFNRTVTEGSAVIYTPAWGRTKAFKPVTLTSSGTWSILTGKCTELLLQLAPGETGIKAGGSQTTKYIVKEIRTNAGTGTLGSYDLAIVGQDITGAPYATVLKDNYRVGDELVLTNTFSTGGSLWPQIEEATSGNSMAMVAGKVIGPADGPVDQTNYNANSYARTLYGTNDDGTKLYIAVCGSKSGVYTGMTTVQLANVLKYFGATYAAQVDCGGSSQLYVDGSQVNRSTDSGDVRNVHSGMFVVSSAKEEVAPVSVALTPNENAYFGEINVYGSASKTYSVKGDNLQGDITISLSGANADQFSLSNTTVLKANQKGSIDVMYHPSAAGTHTATMTVTTAGHDPISVTLGGSAVMKAGADAIYQDDAAAFGYAAPSSYEMETEYVDRAIPELAGHVIKRVIARGDVLYILGHNGNDATLVVFDHVNGRVIRNLGTTANTVGIRGISDIAITADGWLVAMNYVEQPHSTKGGTASVLQYVWARDGEGIAQGDPLPANITILAGNYNYAYAGESMAWAGTRTTGWWYYTAQTTGSSGDTRMMCLQIKDMQLKGSTFQNNTQGFLKKPTQGDYMLFASPYADNEYIFNSSQGDIRLIPRVDTNTGVPTVKATVSANVVPTTALHTGIFRFGGKIYMTSPSFRDNTINCGILLIDITGGLDKATAVGVAGTAMSDYNSTNVATTGVGTAVIKDGQYQESRMALFAVRNGAVTKFITPTTIAIDPEEQPDIITSLQSVDFGEMEIGTSAARSFSIEGVNLQGDINLTLSGSSDFKLSQSSISADEASGSFSIIYTPTTRGEASATLIVSTKGMRSIEYTFKGKGAGEFGLRAYAYGLKVEEKDNRYDFTFSLNAKSHSVDLVLKGAGDKVYTYPQGAMDAGTHTLSVPFSLLDPDKYTWEVNVANRGEKVGDKFFHEAPAKLDARGGVVAIKDTESDAFGLIVTSAGYAQGFTVYNGDLSKRGTYLAGHSGWTASNRSSLYRIAYRPSDGCIYGIDYADASAGIYVFNPLHPEYGTGNIFSPAGATKDSGGCWSLNGVALGGGGNGLCFTGTGENTMLWSVQEDYPKGNAGNLKVVIHHIGTATHVTTAPVATPAALQQSSPGVLSNGMVGMAPCSYGVFMGQHRAATGGHAGFIFSDLEGNVKFDSKALNVTCSGGIAINREENLLAVALYGGIINLYDVTWSNNVPSLTFKGTVNGAVCDTNETSQLDFDYAGNLYAFYRSTSANYDGLNVFVLPYEAGIVSTPSPKSQAFDGTLTCGPTVEMTALTHQAQINLEGTYALAGASAVLNTSAKASAISGNAVAAKAQAAKLTIAEQPGGLFTISSEAGYLCADGDALRWDAAAGDNALFSIAVDAAGTATVATAAGRKITDALTVGDTAGTLRLLATDVRTVVEVGTLAAAAEAKEDAVSVVKAKLNVLHAALSTDGKTFDVFFTDGTTVAAAHMAPSAISSLIGKNSVAEGAMLTANTDADKDVFAFRVLDGNARGFEPLAETHTQTAAPAYIHTAKAEGGLTHVRLENVTVSGGNAGEGYTLAHAFDRQTIIGGVVGHMGIADMVATDGEKAPVYDIEGFLYSTDHARSASDMLFISSVEPRPEGYVLPGVTLTVDGEELVEMTQFYMGADLRFVMDEMIADKAVVFYTKDGGNPQDYLAAGVAPVADPAMHSTIDYVDRLDMDANENAAAPAGQYSTAYYTHNSDWLTWEQYAAGKVFYYFANGSELERSFFAAPRSLWSCEEAQHMTLKSIAVLMPQDVDDSHTVHFANALTMDAAAFVTPATWEAQHSAAAEAAAVRRAAAQAVKTGHSDMLDMDMYFTQTGVEEISTGSDGEADYYDLQGIYRGNDAKDLAPGIYLRHTANGTEKVVIK